jgi:hypothetical protein
LAVAESAATNRARVARWKAVKKQMIREYKTARGCADCGEQDLVVLDLHHERDERDPRTAPNGRSGWNPYNLGVLALFRELMKCDVVCANDHRRRHA